MNREQTIKLLAVISSAYPNMPEMTEAQFTLWANMLQDIPFDKAQANLREHILSSRFPPTIADIARHDPAVNVDYARLKSETAERFAEMESWEQKALPECPGKYLPKFLGRGTD